MSALVAAARSYLGTPFRHRGRTRRGLDCVGLIWRAYADLGHMLVDRRVYGREPHADGLREALCSALGPPLLATEAWQPGDVALIEFDGVPHHVGLFGDYLYGGLSLIHSYGEIGGVVEHRLDDEWRMRVLAVHRLAPEGSG